MAIETSENPVACLLTPPGSGGIAVIEVRGAGVEGIVSRIFHPKSPSGWEGGAVGRLHYGHVLDGDAVVDEVIVRLVERGESGEGIEINCHGGIVTAAETMRLLVEAGAAEVSRGERLTRLACGARFDRVQAEALTLLPSAETRLAVRVLCDQLDGALLRELRTIDTEHPDAAVRFDRLAESGASAARATPRRLALVGSPNAGKSTLFNALVGHNRTIVSPVPGTTRDFISEFVALGGYPIELVDTAGLRRHGGVIEMKGVEATWRVVSGADVVVLVIDASRAIAVREREMIESLALRRPIVVLNKSDLGTGRSARGGGPEGAVRLSALTGDGLPLLERAIRDRFPDPASWPPGSAVVFTEAQADSLRRAAESCRRGDPAAARTEIAALLAPAP